MAERDSIPGSTVESMDVKETAKCERRWGGLFAVNSARRHCSSSLACKCESKIVIQQEFNSCWVLFFVAQSNFYLNFMILGAFDAVFMSLSIHLLIFTFFHRLVTLQCCSL